MNEALRKRMEEMAEQYAVECRGYDFKYDNVPIAKAIRTCYEKGFTACSEIYQAKLKTILEVSEDARSMAELIKELE